MKGKTEPEREGEVREVIRESQTPRERKRGREGGIH